MRYPRTPRSEWLTVKIDPEAAESMRELYRDGNGESLTAIGKLYDVSHHTVQKYVDPQGYARWRANQTKAEVPKDR